MVRRSHYKIKEWLLPVIVTVCIPDNSIIQVLVTYTPGIFKMYILVRNNRTVGFKMITNQTTTSICNIKSVVTKKSIHIVEINVATIKKACPVASLPENST